MTKRSEVPRRLLLDTHALLWWMLDDRRLPRGARTAISGRATTAFVSAASVWEITTKHRRGRLPLPPEFAADVVGAIAAEGFESLAVLAQHAQIAGSMPGTLQDPFDRMLIAQARAERLALVSDETTFDAFGVVRLW
jgi:PIN domain nuclease of toxin-antitoxin system